MQPNKLLSHVILLKKELAIRMSATSVKINIFEVLSTNQQSVNSTSAKGSEISKSWLFDVLFINRQSEKSHRSLLTKAETTEPVGASHSEIVQFLTDTCIPSRPKRNPPFTLALQRLKVVLLTVMIEKVLARHPPLTALFSSKMEFNTKTCAPFDEDIPE